MAVAVASSSRRTSNLNPASATSSSPRRPPVNDVFKPKLPLDPFVNMDFRKRDPIVVPSERLFSAAAGEPRRDVILVIGTPSADDLCPLLYSDQLAFSLLIIASHEPPTIPGKVQPTIRVLRLAAPLGVEQAGAVRFVNILEWAERVARSWRKNGGIGVRELNESDEGGLLGALAPPPNLLRSNNSNGSLHASSKSTPPSPLTSTLHLDSQSGEAASTTKSKRSRKSRTSKRESKLPAADPCQRPFDALINFLPRLSGLSEKSLLKQAILITTISRPFLVAAIPPSLARLSRPASKRKSFLGRASVHSVYSLPPTPPMSSGDSVSSLPSVLGSRPTRAHLVHLLPSPPKPKAGSRRSYSFNTSMNRVLSSIESFLLGFSVPQPLMDPGSTAMRTDAPEPAKTFLTDSAAWAENVATGMELNWTVADMILSGCLDVDAPGALQSPAASPPRAWISGATDILVSVSASSPALLGTVTPVSVPPPAPARTPSASQRRQPHFPEADQPPVPKLPTRTSYFSRQGPQLPTPPASDESVSEREGVPAPPAKAPGVHTRQRSMSMGVPGSARMDTAEKRQVSNPDVQVQKKSRWKFWRRGQR